jgi:hypothetical protein
MLLRQRDEEILRQADGAGTRLALRKPAKWAKRGATRENAAHADAIRGSFAIGANAGRFEARHSDDEVAQAMSESRDKSSEGTAAVGLSCRADFIFDARMGDSASRPIKVLSECMCDFRRPDWEGRWNDWLSGRNPYLNLFLCEEHAKKLGLLR